MKKKRILNEEVTRRLMKMANLDTYTEDFLNESEELEENDLEEGEELEEEDSLEEDVQEEGEELEEVEKVKGAHADHKLKNAPKSKRNHLEEGLPPEDDMGGGPPMDDAPAPPMDDPMGDMGDEMGMEDGGAPTVEGLIDAIVMTIEAEAPGYLDVQSDEPMGDEMPPMDGPPTDEVPMDDEMPPPEMEEAGPRYKGATKEVPMESKKVVDNKINEVAAYIASQVTSRLKNKNRK